MSAVKLVPHHPDSPQACVFIVLKRLIYLIGVCETARLLKCSDDTISRHIATGNINSFGYDDIIRLKKRERDEFGTRELHDAETRALFSYEAPQDVRAHLSREIGADASIIAKANEVLADGKLDRADLATLEKLKDELDRQSVTRRELGENLAVTILEIKRGK